MKIYTIGFTKKTAEQFFETLCASGAERLVDVRLNNVSQLAGFAKKQDLAYFLERICSMQYGVWSMEYGVCALTGACPNAGHPG
jgi:uncharacterized protein (DUF488 family)